MADDALVPPLSPPVEFEFPYEPYNVQRDFMKSLFQTIEAGGLGIFESPTGTGKSMSLLCGAMTWLRANAARMNRIAAAEASAAAAAVDDDEPDWVRAHAAKEAGETILRREEKERELQEKYALIRSTMSQKRDYKRRKIGNSVGSSSGQSCGEKGGPAQPLCGAESDEDFLVPDYDSDSVPAPRYESSDDDDEAGPAEEDQHVTKILFCSRTHSQLAQVRDPALAFHTALSFLMHQTGSNKNLADKRCQCSDSRFLMVEEIRKSPFGDTVRVIALGSRENLCVNESARAAAGGSLARLNDKCKDLATKKVDKAPGETKAPKSGCPFNEKRRVSSFADRALAEVQDIEKLAEHGKQTHTCAYYGSRKGIPAAEIVLMPYNLLLHKSTRESVGIKLEGNIVIVDEAHNLISTVENIHSIIVTGAVLQRSLAQLSAYVDKYKKRLNTKNLVYVRQIIAVLRGLLRFLSEKPPALSSTQEEEQAGKVNGIANSIVMHEVTDFLYAAKIDNINLFRLERYFTKSEISKKLNGFVIKYEEASPSVVPSTSSATEFDGLQSGAREESEYVSKHVSALRMVEGFLSALQNATRDGRIVVERNFENPAKCSIKYLLLNSAVYFEEVLAKCRAVIVAGGTMAPVADFVEQLVPPSMELSPPRIFSCGHVIPPEHLHPLVLGHGPSGLPLNFSFKNRSDKAMGVKLAAEVGQLILNLCNVVPDGLVVFMPSYAYESQLYNAWESTGILGRISTKKRVFREPKKSGGVDEVLSAYSDAIDERKGGAVLLSVVGGKMSEGINFKDKLGRCVVMIGLPFPNQFSPELQEKMAYLSAASKRRSKQLIPGEMPTLTKEDCGQLYYQNLCMKAVNQSIGRAIRHRSDYATVVFADCRYGENRIVNKLPRWVARSLVKFDSFGPAVGSIRKFFKGRAAAADAASQAAQAAEAAASEAAHEARLTALDSD